MELRDDPHEETRSEKLTRYRHQSLEESSDVELWMEIHHMEDMEDAVAPMEVEQEQHDDPAIQNMIAARDRARRVYEERRQNALDRNDLDELDALECNYEWLYHV